MIGLKSRYSSLERACLQSGPNLRQLKNRVKYQGQIIQVRAKFENKDLIGKLPHIAGNATRVKLNVPFEPVSILFSRAKLQQN